MHLRQSALLLAVSGILSFGQLTMDQKISDFQYTAGVYAKRYAPYEWKRDGFGFDLLDIAPWLDRVRATKNDLDFYDVTSLYVASLNDAHDRYTLPSNFVATLNFTADIYDAKLLVDSVNRQRLPAAEFPFLSGYELVSIDGVDAQKLLDSLARYSVYANPRSTRRGATALLTTRSQRTIASAPNVPEISTVVFRRPDGNLESYRIPWAKTGVPLTSVGKYHTPQRVGESAMTNSRVRLAEDDREDTQPPAGPVYSQVLRRLQNYQIPDTSTVGLGSVLPVFAASLPDSFVQRLGKSFTDPFFSGVFESSGFKIGFIRIPSFSPAVGTDAAVTAFQKEIAFFKANTDGLVIDEMHNGGGDGGYTNQLLSFLMPSTWRIILAEVRATSEWVAAVSSELELAKATGAPQNIVDLYQGIRDEMIAANRVMHGRTKAIPLDDVTVDRDPAKDGKGALLAYTKPLMVLVDEFSASAAEIFAATIQDNGRGPLFGWRTMGAGGSVESWWSGSYSLGVISVTESLLGRQNPLVTSDYPASPYIENIGVRPDIQVDYMTADNLSNSGKAFVDAFTAAMVDHIQGSR